MSTKTTLKRIALVAVSALGFGLLSVVPARAAVTFTSITVGTLPAFRVGETATIPVTVNMSDNLAADTITISAKITSAPISGGLQAVNNGISVLGYTAAATQDSDSSQRLWFGQSNGALGAAHKDKSNYTFGPLSTTSGAYANGNSYSGIFCSTSTAGTLVGAGSTGCVVAAAEEETIGADDTLSKTFYLSVKPDVAGSYSLIISVDDLPTAGTGTQVAADRSYVAGNTHTTLSFTASSTAPAKIVMTNSGSHPISSDYGSLVKISLQDSSGNPAMITGDEAIAVTVSGGYVVKAGLSSNNFSSGTMGTATTATLGRADFLNGIGFVNVLGSARGTVTVTATGAGTLASSVASSHTLTATYASTLTSETLTFTGSTTGWDNTSGANWDIKSTATSSTLKWTHADLGLDYASVIVTDKGAISGLTNKTGNTLIFNRAMTIADDALSTSLTLTHSALGDDAGTYLVDLEDVTFAEITVSGETAVGSDVAISPSAISSATGATNAISATVTDQFGNVMVGVAVTVTVAGRNSARASETLITNSEGVVTASIVDSGTTGVSDVVTFTSGSDSSTSTITYGTYTVSTVLLTTPNTTTTGADEYPVDAEDIYASDGAEGSLQTVTATVKDANGLVMSGIPVTFTVAGTGVAITSTTAVTRYTNASGQASVSVYAWLAGTYTVTATAGGVTDTAPVIFAQETATEARSISASVSGNTITATVKDRFGNTIAGVPVKVTRTAGAGYFGSATTAEANTGTDGTVTFVVTGGSATVTVGFTTSTYGQSDALAGLIDGTTATNVFTAYTAGTANTDEEGVGDTFSAAGINSVSVSVSASDPATEAATAASDAALEAIDAANAATDAANLAAEAADAATVAAEEARDAADAATAAVEALASEVATLIAGLKAQITTLANTVAKIAKKVKA